MSQANERLDGLRELPKVIAAAVERGYVARMPPTMTPAAQRLFESLGVPVMFDSDAAEPDLVKTERAVRKMKRKRRSSRGNRPKGKNREELLKMLADGKTHTTSELVKKVPSASVYLGFMIQEGIVERIEKGVYRKIVCRFEAREDPPGSGNGVAWCLTHLCVHGSDGV